MGGGTSSGSHGFVSRKEDPYCVDCYELDSGYLEQTFYMLQDEATCDVALEYLACCGSRLLAYDAQGRFFSAYNVSQNVGICTLKLVRPDASANKNIGSMCPARERDGMFFFSFQGESSLYVLLLTEKEGYVSKPIRVDFGAFDKVENFKESAIMNIRAHPTRPYIFIMFESGSVQVWNYSGLKKVLLTQLGAEDLMEGEGGYGNPNDSGDDMSVPDLNVNISDDMSDSGSQASYSSKAPSVIGSISGAIFRRKKESKAFMGMIPCSLLTLPGVADKKNVLHNPAAAVELQLHANGCLAAIVWQRQAEHITAETIAVYDIRQSFAKPGQAKVGAISITLPKAGFAECSIPGWRLGPICFHSFEPILLATMCNEGGADHMLYALSLRDRFLRTIGSADIEHSTNNSNSNEFPLQIRCVKETGKIVLTMGLKNNQISTISVHALTAEWMSAFGTLSQPLISACNISFEDFIDCEDILLQPKPLNTKPSKPRERRGNGNGKAEAGGGREGKVDWPITLVVKPELTLPAQIFSKTTAGSGGPLYLKLNIYKAHLSALLMEQKKEKESEEVAQVSDFLGSIDAACSLVNTDVNRNWLSLDNQVHIDVATDTINYEAEGLFHPSEVRASLLGDDVFGIIRGTFCIESEDIHQLISLPSVYVLCKKSSQNESLLHQATAFRDASFWNGNSINAGEDKEKLNSRSCILALSASGCKIVWIQVNESSDMRAGHIIESWVSATSMSRVWTAPSGALNIVLYASSPKGGVQTLFATAPGRGAFDAMHMAGLPLREGEVALDVKWQPWPKHDQGSFKELTKREDVGSCVSQLLGVLTTHRVFILSRDKQGLQILNSVVFRDEAKRWNTENNVSSPSKSNQHGKDKVTSMQWLGISLVYSSASGSVHYIVPSAVTQTLSQEQLIENLLRNRSLGMENLHSHHRGHLCSLPSNCFELGALRILACLPDRILYAASAVDPSTGLINMSIMARPCLPVEPMILGLLAVKDAAVSLQTSSEDNAIALPWKKRAITIEQYCDKMVYCLVMLYFKARFSTGSKEDEEFGNKPSSHSSRRLCTELFSRRQDDTCRGLAVIAAAITLSDIDPTEEFPPTRWLPPSFKFEVALAADMPSQACLELMAGRLEMQDAFLDAQAYVDLPHPKSAKAMQIAAAKEVLREAGYTRSALGMADLVGDDLFIADVLRKKGKLGEEKFLDACKSSDTIDPLVPVLIENDMAHVYVSLNNLLVKNMGGAGRRSSMFTFTSAIKDKREVGKDKVGEVVFDQTAFCATQRNHAQHRGGVLGPNSKLGSLGMDVTEEWVGTRLQLESVPVVAGGVFGGESIFSFGAGSEGSTVNGDEGESGVERKLPDGGDLPDSWVEGVGIGRDMDKVSGYWRFSDIVHAEDPRFISSCSRPGTRACFLDLSKYEQPLQAFAASDTDMKLCPSTSSVHSGEEHDKQKLLYDVVYACKSASEFRGHQSLNGLRTLVKRGTHFDIGMHHNDQDRCKMTIEFSISFRGSELMGDTCLLQRVLGFPIEPKGQQTRQPGVSLWDLCVDKDSYLVWSCGQTPEKSFKSSRPLPNFNLATTAESESKSPTDSSWVNVAVVVNSSGDSEGASGIVSLYANGEQIGTTPNAIEFPTHKEADLADSTLYVAPGMGPGWRFTELRIWADARTSGAIEESHMSTLPLASKRKRLQLRIPGGKKLFTPLNEDSFYLGDEFVGERKVSSANGNNDRKKDKDKDKAENGVAKSSTQSGVLLPPGGSSLVGPSSGANIVNPTNDPNRLGAPRPLARPPQGGGLLKAPVGGGMLSQRKAKPGMNMLALPPRK